MYLDNYLLLSDAQAIAAAATTVSTNKVDLGASTVRRQVATGEPMGIALAIDVAADFTTGDETYQFDVVSDEDAALGSPTIHGSFVLTAAQLAAGSLHFLPLPQSDNRLYERYLGLQVVTGGTSPSITFTAWVTSHDLFSVQARAYSKNYAV